MNAPTNKPTAEPADLLTDMLRKAILAERAWIAFYLQTHKNEPVEELARAVADGAHLEMR